MHKFSGVAGILICLSLIASTTWGATINVPADHLTIQEAVDAAVAGDVIMIAAGVFSDPVHIASETDTTKCCVILKSGVSLQGAGIDVTYIDAAHHGRGINCEDVENATISHMTITNSFAEVIGPAIFCKNSSPNIHHVSTSTNFDGGISLINGSSPQIWECKMNNNEAKAGGGIDIGEDCEPFIFDCEILGNHAPFAAGIRIKGDPTLAYCNIAGNETTSPTGAVGGGIMVIDLADPVIRFCTITDNISTGEGGGIGFEGEGTLGSMDNCLVKDNIAASYSESEAKGGGISVNSRAFPTITNTVICGNHNSSPWSDGGGVCVTYAAIRLENCTIYNNWSDGYDAGNIGITTSMYYPTNIVITRCIVSDCQNGKGIHIAGAGVEPTVECCNVYNNEGGDGLEGSIGTGNFSLDPLFCDAANGIFYLLDTSPCAPGNHPDGAGTCDGDLIGAKPVGCDAGVDEEGLSTSMLLGNTPNPFNRGTNISFALSSSQEVTLEIFDMNGRRISMLHDGLLPAGQHEINWNGISDSGEPSSAGIYFYRLKAAGQIESMRMLRVR